MASCDAQKTLHHIYSCRSGEPLNVLLVACDFQRESKPRRIVRGIASGYRICVSPQENLGHLIGTDETHLQRAIRKYVSVGDTDYDIGANVGYVSLCFAKRVGTGGRVLHLSWFHEISKRFGETSTSIASRMCACWRQRPQRDLENP